MDPAATSLVVLAAVVALFLWNRLSVGVVAVFTALSLYVTGVLDARETLAGFGDPVVIFVASLFVVCEALDYTGVTAWAGQALTARAGTGRGSLLIAIMVLAALVTAVVSPNASVAALLPMVVLVALRNGHSPSQMALPLAFGAHAGSLLALSGTPVNVIVSDAAVRAGAGRFGFFEFAIVGVPLLAVTILISTVLGPRLLPAVGARSALADLSRHARTLSGHYALQDGFYRLRVRADSHLVGGHLPGLGEDPPGLEVIGVQAASGASARPDHVFAEGDAIIVTGATEDVVAYAESRRLGMASRPTGVDDLITRESGIVEVVVPPRSPLVGERVFPGMVRVGEIVVLAVHHHGEEADERGIVLTEGDSLLLHGLWPAIEALVEDRDILVVDPPDRVRRQTVLGTKAVEAMVALVAMVVLIATGAAPPAIAGLGAAAAIVAVGVLTPQQAYRAVSWQIIVLLGGLIPLSTAISSSGAADDIANVLLGAVGDLSPYLLLVVIFAVTATLGQVVSNTATVLIVVPIAVAAAVESGVSVEPVLMTVAVSGAASFLTPIATPANMMVMGPGGYRFGDYWRLGSVILAAWLVIALLVIPVAWPLDG